MADDKIKDSEAKGSEQNSESTEGGAHIKSNKADDAKKSAKLSDTDKLEIDELNEANAAAIDAVKSDGRKKSAAKKSADAEGAESEKDKPTDTDKLEADELAAVRKAAVEAVESDKAEAKAAATPVDLDGDLTETEKLELDELSEARKAVLESLDDEDLAAGGSTSATTGKSAAKMLKVWQAIVCAVITLAIGLVLGWLLLPSAGSGIGKTAVTEGQLGTVVATYNSPVGSASLTVQDVYDGMGTFQTAKQSDGTYIVPSADSILSIAQNDIITRDAQNQGFTATDDEVTTYAQNAFGSSDLATIASNYSTDEDTVKALLRQTVIQSKLRDKVIGNDGSSTTQPTAPTAPADGNAQAASKEYADYIIGLAGDEWDATAQTWKDPSGSYAQALSAYEVTNDSATYEAAQAAYSVAYSAYSSQSSTSSNKWTEYVNDLLSKSSILISTIAS